MLYITTRDKRDAHTAYRTLTQDRGPDGGFFVPYRMPVLNMDDYRNCSFGQTVADILNRFFAARLTGWDVDLAVGRSCVKLVPMNYRLWTAELWRNQGQSFDWIVQTLNARLRDGGHEPTEWVRIAVRIAVLGGIFGELCRSTAADAVHPVDVAVAAGDFSAVCALRYAREMGMPVGTVICASNDNSSVWDLLHQGQLHTDAAVISTGLPEMDYQLPPGLERLVFASLGYDGCRDYVDACRRGGLYAPGEDGAAALSRGLYSTVVSRRRMEDIIRSVHRTSTRILDPHAAYAFGALQDYRAKTGESRPALILSEHTPARSGIAAAALGLNAQALKQLLQG